MKFDGDIIIIDPCNVVKSEADWALCRYGEDLTVLGFSQHLYIDAGDEYGCRLVDTDTGETLGSFCTDSAVLAVLLLEELLTYNPDFRDHIDCPDSNTVIPEFDGEVTVDESRFRICGKGSHNFTSVED